MAYTYGEWHTEPRDPSVTGAPGGVTCGRIAPSNPSSSPSAAPAAAAVPSSAQRVEPGQEQEQLAAEALASSRVESVGAGTETHTRVWPQDTHSWLSEEAILQASPPVPSAPACAPG